MAKLELKIEKFENSKNSTICRKLIVLFLKQHKILYHLLYNDNEIYRERKS